MVGTEYTVASASKLLGAKPPKRRARPEDWYFAKMKAADDASREKSALKRAEHARKTVRFTPSTKSVGPDGSMQNASSGSAQHTTSGSSRTTSDDVTVVEPTPIRVQKLRTTSEELLDYERLWCREQSNPVDSSDPSLSRSGSTASRRDRKDVDGNEIYFSPIDATTSQVFLSSPQPSPPLTPTDESTQATDDSSEYQTPAARLTLTTQQVDRLVTAMAHAPLVQMNVRKQHWADLPENMLASPLSSTVSVGSDEEPPQTLAPTIYSQPNQPFFNKQPAPPASLEGVALTDPSIHGTPIRFASKTYQLGNDNVLKVGACSYLNTPYGASADSSLREISPSSGNPHCRVLLQAVSTVLDRTTGRKKFLLTAEVDVTASFARAALTELAISAGIEMDEVGVVLPAADGASTKRDSEGSIDWCALADEFAANCTVSDKVESTASAFAKLTAETCSMQTLTLIAELERIRAQHSDFMVLQPTRFDEAGRPGGIKTPFISQSLQQRLCPDRALVTMDSARAFRHELVAALGPGLTGEEEFKAQFLWSDAQRYVRCVPLVDGVSDKAAFWVCFVAVRFDVL